MLFVVVTRYLNFHSNFRLNFDFEIFANLELLTERFNSLIGHWGFIWYNERNNISFRFLNEINDFKVFDMVCSKPFPRCQSWVSFLVGFGTNRFAHFPKPKKTFRVGSCSTLLLLLLTVTWYLRLSFFKLLSNFRLKSEIDIFAF